MRPRPAVRPIANSCLLLCLALAGNSFALASPQLNGHPYPVVSGKVLAEIRRIAALPVPEEPTFLAEDLSDDQRVAICAGLLIREARVRDAALTIASIRECEEVRDVLQSVGPTTREIVAPIFLEWADHKDHRKWKVGVEGLDCLSATPAKLIPKLVEIVERAEEGNCPPYKAIEWLRNVEPHADVRPVLQRLLAEQPDWDIKAILDSHEEAEMLVQLRTRAGPPDVEREILPALEKGAGGFSFRLLQEATSALEAADGRVAVAAVIRELKRKDLDQEYEERLWWWLADTKHPTASAKQSTVSESGM